MPNLHHIANELIPIRLFSNELDIVSADIILAIFILFIIMPVFRISEIHVYIRGDKVPEKWYPNETNRNLLEITSSLSIKTFWVAMYGLAMHLVYHILSK